MFDIVVIGKGLLGSAAIRHISKYHPDQKTAIIGPDEPKDMKTHTGVFSSHYDEARITRVLDSDIRWATLAAKSIERYAEIAKTNPFHEPVGCLHLTSEEQAANNIAKVAEHFAVDQSPLSPEDYQKQFPYLNLNIKGEVYGFHERGNAGYVNPRQLIVAQLIHAKNQGAEIIHETVTDYTLKDKHITLSTDKGNTIKARKIIIAAGGFTNLLLKNQVNFKLKAHSIVLGVLSDTEVQRLATLPSFITHIEGMEEIYLLPPVKYPDGKTYIKLGLTGQKDGEDYVETHEQLQDWFHSDGNPLVVDRLKMALHQLFPNLQVTDYVSKPCLITYTEHGNPYIDTLVPDRVYIAAGGNGAAAKSSDEMGRLAALLATTNQWDSELSQDDFRAIIG